jgi:HD-GYP domain-containing protein (c-di-GMP phosphodiesterase class II)/DNA-binding CsgD family transcriptional regulator
VRHVYELWQGGGAPHGLAGDDVPLASRLARLGGLAVLFDSLGGPALAAAAVRARAGGMLDPALAHAFADRAPALLAEVGAGDPRVALLEAEPVPVAHVLDPALADVARVFGDVADLKTPATHGHARGVATLAVSAGRDLGVAGSDLVDLELAALLQDVGRVAVPDRVWEAPGPLGAGAREQVRLHAYHAERILAGSERLAVVAPLAGSHHERLDGSGYHRGTSAPDLPTAVRVLAVADAYDAMTHDRPHRAALAPEQARVELEAEVAGGRLDGDAVAAVLRAAGHAVVAPAPRRPAGLSPREVEVLGLVAAGATNRQVAERLGISRRTAEHHVQHVYAKIGVSSRAAAALFAMEHGLLGDAGAGVLA